VKSRYIKLPTNLYKRCAETDFIKRVQKTEARKSGMKMDI